MLASYQGRSLHQALPEEDGSGSLSSDADNAALARVSRRRFRQFAVVAVMLMASFAFVAKHFWARGPSMSVGAAAVPIAGGMPQEPHPVETAANDFFVVKQEGGPYSPAPEDVTWRYDPVNNLPLGIRPEPTITSGFNEHELKKGEIFDVSQMLRGIDGVLYLKLADGRGWVFEYKPGVGVMCVRQDAPKPVFSPGMPRPGTLNVLKPNAVPHLPALGCALVGEDCSKSKCCRNSDRTCFSKDQYYATCRTSCDPGDNKTDTKDWSCEKLGGAVQIPVINSVPPGEPGIAGTSMFCITVVMPDSAEVPLAAYQQNHKVGVFACEEAWWINGVQAPWHAEGESIPNANVFAEIWRQVQYDGRYRNYDWTVKVDPDTVFFPDRLRQHLRLIRPPAHTALYLKNCDFKFGFLGSLEILSTMAVDAYLQGQDDCAHHIQLKGGEDYYLKRCMDSIGVGNMEDKSLLNDRYNFEKYPGKLLVNSTEDCQDGWAVAFHPHKYLKEWTNCHSAAKAALEHYQASKTAKTRVLQ